MKNVRENLRVVVSLSSAEGKFQKISFTFTSLISLMELICLKHWSKQQLITCAKFHLKGRTVLSDDEADNLAHLLASLHLELREQDPSTDMAGQYGTITNTNFELFVERFLVLYESTREAV